MVSWPFVLKSCINRESQEQMPLLVQTQKDQKEIKDLLEILEPLEEMVFLDKKESLVFLDILVLKVMQEYLDDLQLVFEDRLEYQGEMAYLQDME
jgi:hypothetical protein